MGEEREKGESACGLHITCQMNAPKQGHYPTVGILSLSILEHTIVQELPNYSTYFATS